MQPGITCEEGSKPSLDQLCTPVQGPVYFRGYIDDNSKTDILWLHCDLHQKHWSACRSSQWQEGMQVDDANGDQRRVSTEQIVL